MIKEIALNEMVQCYQTQIGLGNLEKKNWALLVK